MHGKTHGKCLANSHGKRVASARQWHGKVPGNRRSARRRRNLRLLDRIWTVELLVEQVARRLTQLEQRIWFECTERRVREMEAIKGKGKGRRPQESSDDDMASEDGRAL